MAEPCYCGAVDCPACYPGCTEKTKCPVCGELYPAWVYETTRLKCCVYCQEHIDKGEKMCAECGDWVEASILNENGECDYCDGRVKIKLVTMEELQCMAMKINGIR